MVDDDQKKRKIQNFFFSSSCASSLHQFAKAVVEGERVNTERKREGERQTERERVSLRVVVFDAFFLSL